VRRACLCRPETAFNAAGFDIPCPHPTLYTGQDKGGKSPPPLAEP
jgi:hypothetical protein